MTERAGPLRRRVRFDITTRPLIYGGNRLRLLENGDEFFPRLLAAINSAAHSIHLETYIFAEDNIGLRVGDALAAAADRGVAVRVVVDGFGTGTYGDSKTEKAASNGSFLALMSQLDPSHPATTS